MTFRSVLRRPRALAAMLLVALAACSSDPFAPVAVSYVELSPAAADVEIGATVQLQAIPRASDTRALDDRIVTFTSLTPAVASVTAQGLVTTLSVGAARLQASVDGVVAEATVLVRALAANGLELDVTDVALPVGQERRIRGTLVDVTGAPIETPATLEWVTEDPYVATIDATGLLRAVGEGTTRVVATSGPFTANVTVEVRGVFVADIIYEAHDATSSFPFLFALDPAATAVPATKLIAFAGTRHAAPSPDGSRIAFTCDVAICVANRDGTGITVLTDGDLSYEDSPTWSPDGQRIAFRRWAQGGSAEQVEQTDIWVMNADGSAPVNITNDAASQGEPAWSPMRGDGGTRIAYREAALVEGYVTHRLYTMRPDGTDRRAETAAGLASATEPAWTPDGAQLVFVQHGGEVTGDLWVLTVGAQDARPLMPSPLAGEQRSPAISPDGRYVLFTSAHEPVPGGGTHRQLYTVRINGTGLLLRTSDPADKSHPAWRLRP